jgi:hypothetical protein
MLPHEIAQAGVRQRAGAVAALQLLRAQRLRFIANASSQRDDEDETEPALPEHVTLIE